MNKIEGSLSRDLYRQIKNMNRDKLDGFIRDFYADAYNDCLEDIKEKYGDIRAGVKKISGIGDVKADLIMEVVKDCLEHKAEGDS